MAVDPLLDTTFTFDGKTFAVRPTFKLVARIERDTMQSGRTLGRKIANGDATLLEIGAAMVNVMQDQGSTLTADEIGEKLMDEGMEGVRSPLVMLLIRASKGNKEHERESLAKKDEPGPGAEAKNETKPDQPKS